MAISQTRTLKTGITSEDVLNFEPVYVYIYGRETDIFKPPCG
jgi:hypothetical protein